MRFERDHLIFKALAALDEVAEAAGSEPIAPSLAVRFALAFLFAVGDGTREGHDGFWSMMRQVMPDDYSPEDAAYIRRTGLRREIERVACSAGIMIDSRFRLALAATHGDAEARNRLKLHDAVQKSSEERAELYRRRQMRG